MDNKELEMLSEETINELRESNGFMKVRDMSVWKDDVQNKNSGAFLLVKNKLLQHGLIAIAPSSDHISLSQKGFEFESFENERKEKKLQKDLLQANYNTQVSIKSLNDKTDKFYISQRNILLFTAFVSLLTLIGTIYSDLKEKSINVAPSSVIIKQIQPQPDSQQVQQQQEKLLPNRQEKDSSN